MMVKPYYEHAGITIYHGDCFEILPGQPTFGFMVTDPPYGIAHIWRGGNGHGWLRARAQGVVRNEWDQRPLNEIEVQQLLRSADKHIIWGGNHFPLPCSRSWLVWVKPERGFTMSEAELAWTNLDSVVRVFELPRSEPGREHPTQKPLSLMTWCLLKTDGTVIDPFMGAGTTLVAAKKLNRTAVGIDLNEEYCEMAAKRLSQEVLTFC